MRCSRLWRQGALPITALLALPVFRAGAGENPSRFPPREAQPASPTQAGGEADHAKATLDAWGKVRLALQKWDARLGPLTGSVTWTCDLEAKEAIAAVPVGFPTRSGAGAVGATADGQELKPMPAPPKTFTMSTDSKKRTGDEEYRRSAVHRCLYAAGAFWYLSGGGWQAFDLSFTAGQKRTVKVEADLKPVQLADSAKDGPCYAFTVPIRLGRVWARPAGKLDATVTLGEDLKPEDVILVRPPEAKRDGRKITLSLDGQEPVEDLIVVVKGKLPESPKPPAKPPAEKPDAVPAPPGRPETF